MCENAYLSIKNPKASRALKRALDPGRRMLASLARLRFTTSATFGLRSWGPLLTKSWICTWFLMCTHVMNRMTVTSKVADTHGERGGSIGSSGWVGGAKKHEIYVTAFGGHLFYDLFLQGWGAMAPSAPPWIRYGGGQE